VSKTHNTAALLSIMQHSSRTTDKLPLDYSLTVQKYSTQKQYFMILKQLSTGTKKLVLFLQINHAATYQMKSGILPQIARATHTAAQAVGTLKLAVNDDYTLRSIAWLQSAGTNQ